MFPEAAAAIRPQMGVLTAERRAPGLRFLNTRGSSFLSSIRLPPVNKFALLLCDFCALRRLLLTANREDHKDRKGQQLLDY